MTREAASMDEAVEAICEAMRAWDLHRGPERWPDEQLDVHARALFARQFEHNAPYRAFCQGRGVTPEVLGGWRDVPAVPTDVFKHVDLSVTAPDQAARVFRTSGTTRDQRGAHAMGTLAAYRASLPGPFARFVLAGAPRPVRMLLLAPSPDDLPDSSLSFMLGELVEAFGAPGSAFFVRRADGSDELVYQLEALRQALDQAAASEEPVALLGTAFGFMELFDGAPTCAWSLPPGSRIMETGGFKGRSREVTRDQLYALFDERLGVPAAHCVSEYSMTELSSQAYTDTLRRAHLDLAQPPAPRLLTPPWARLQVVDPVTLEPLEGPGQRGLIRWLDLANVDSVLAIQTSDVGVTHPGGLELVGRAPDAELRGCSLTIEEIVEGGAGR